MFLQIKSVCGSYYCQASLWFILLPGKFVVHIFARQLCGSYFCQASLGFIVLPGKFGVHIFPWQMGLEFILPVVHVCLANGFVFHIFARQWVQCLTHRTRFITKVWYINAFKCIKQSIIPRFLTDILTQIQYTNTVQCAKLIVVVTPEDILNFPPNEKLSSKLTFTNII